MASVFIIRLMMEYSYLKLVLMHVEDFLTNLICSYSAPRCGQYNIEHVNASNLYIGPFNINIKSVSMSCHDDLTFLFHTFNVKCNWAFYGIVTVLSRWYMYIYLNVGYTKMNKNKKLYIVFY